VDERRGLLQVYTGDGKGKTTAAVGLAARARGAGMSVAFVQFVKGGPESSEIASLRALGVEVIRPGVATSGLMSGPPTDEDLAAVAVAWEAACERIASGAHDLVVLDEIDIALAHGMLDEDAVLRELRARPAGVEVVCTGRGATEGLLAEADLVTEMRAVRHPFDAGVPARRGIEI